MSGPPLKQPDGTPDRSWRDARLSDLFAAGVLYIYNNIVGSTYIYIYIYYDCFLEKRNFKKEQAEGTTKTLTLALVKAMKLSREQPAITTMRSINNFFFTKTSNIHTTTQLLDTTTKLLSTGFQIASNKTKKSFDQNGGEGTGEKRTPLLTGEPNITVTKCCQRRKQS